MTGKIQNANSVRSPDQVFQRFEQLVSRTRLKPYRRATQSKEEAVALYLWNVALSEALYPALSFFEIGFRNAMHDALSAVRGDAHTQNPRWFMDPLLEERHQRQVIEAMDRLRAQGKPVDAAGAPIPVEPGRVIADLSLGFWVALYSAPYTASIFNPTVARVFPHSPKSVRVQATLHARLHELLDLRNRVFHQEPIYYQADLASAHTRLREVLGWIEPECLHFLDGLDRFGRVFAAGPAGLRTEAEFAFLAATDSPTT